MVRPRYLSRQLAWIVPIITSSNTVESWILTSTSWTSRRWMAPSHSSLVIMNGPVERVPISTKSLWSNDCSRSMSLLHSASRHSVSSFSISLLFGSATHTLSPAPSLGPNSVKANLSSVTFQDKTFGRQGKWFPVKRSLAEVVSVEAQQKTVAAPRGKREMAADRLVNRDQRLDR